MRRSDLKRVLGTKLLGVIAGAAISGFASNAAATTYQVGPSRTHKTLGAVAQMLSSGDIVELDGNATYTGGTAFWNVGAPGSPITIRGMRVNGRRPILSGGNNTIEAGGDHYVFEGLEITGGTSRCFYHHAHDIVLRDSLVRDCPKQGVLGADTDSGSLLMEYVEVTRCGNGTFDHQIYMATDESNNGGSVFRMQYCYVHHGNGGNNVKSRAERNEIYYNWLEGGFYHELELIGPDPAGGVGTSAREDSDVVGNVLVKGNTFSVVRFGGDGTGETNGRYRFVNNTVIVKPSGGAVFRLFDGLQSVEMHNNVFMVDGSGTVNLLRVTEAVWTNNRQIAGSRNWMRTGTTPVSEWTGTLVGDDPGFQNFAAFNLVPTASSPLVNAGSSSTSGPPGYAFPSPLAAPAWHSPAHAVGLPGSAVARPSAGTIDIGAYEYGSGSGGSGGSGGSSGTGGSGTGGAGTGGSATGGTGTGGSSGGGVGGSSGSGVGGSSGSGVGGSSGGGVGGSSGSGAGGSSGSGAGGSSGDGAGGTGVNSGGTAGSTSAGGSGASSGASGSSAGGKTGAGGKSGAEIPALSEDEGSCACRAPAERSSRSFNFLLVLAFGAIAFARRLGTRCKTE